MEIENAKRLISTWAEMDPVRVYEPKKKQPERRTSRERRRAPKLPDLSKFGKKYGILLISAALCRRSTSSPETPAGRPS